MKFKEITLEELFIKNSKKKLILPNFQRSYVWKENNQKTLLASFLLSLPIGNVLILVSDEKEFAARDLCFPEQIEISGECEYLLDGQQRISTLKNIFSDLYSENKDWRKIWDRLPYSLRGRWFLKVIPEHNDDMDIFNYLNLKFIKKDILKLEPSQIEDLLIKSFLMVKNSHKWFHPNFCPVDSKGKKLSTRARRNEIAKSSSQLGLVPLFELFDANNTSSKLLHKLSLEKIAAKRATDLRHELEGDNEHIAEILEDVEPNIDDILLNLKKAKKKERSSNKN